MNVPQAILWGGGFAEATQGKALGGASGVCDTFARAATRETRGGGPNKPVGMIVDSRGNILIADSGSKCVALFKTADCLDVEP